MAETLPAQAPDAERLRICWRKDSRGSPVGGKMYWAEVSDGRLLVMTGVEAGRWHLSISHRSNILGPDGKALPGRYPTWDEIARARYDLLPGDLTFGILLPPKSQYVNLHPTCFHLHEIRDT